MPESPIPTTETLYHGTNRLFRRFDLGHVLEGDGKVKFGWGVYVTDRVDSALEYARKSQARRPGSGCFVYRVEVPALAPGNHVAFGEPVDPAVAARVREALGAEIPAAALADGKLFRKFAACRLEGSKRKTPTLAGEKAAAELLDRLGVVCVSWPFSWTKDAEGRFRPPFNRAVFDAAKVRVVSVDRYDDAGNVVETIPASKLPRQPMRVSDSIRLHYPQYWGFRTYPADRACAVSKISAEWGVFSNFARTPLVVDGVPFDTSERLFQTMKFADPEARRAVYAKKGNPKMAAKHWRKDGFLRPDWAEHDVDAMKFCLMEKFRQSEAFRAELARSGDRPIVEDQTTFPRKTADAWGVKRTPDGAGFVGPNLLGRLLMELRAGGGTLAYTRPLPADMTSFRDLA